jgi:hypothetical protein
MGVDYDAMKMDVLGAHWIGLESVQIMEVEKNALIVVVGQTHAEVQLNTMAIVQHALK